MTMRTRLRAYATRLWLVVYAGMLAAGGLSAACTTTPPAVGSRNVASAEPGVPRPGTTPCVVTLFSNRSFGRHGGNTRMDADPASFKYVPPAGCTGDWAKVVLVADFTVDRGERYDRTASLWLDGVNIYFGTTQEPWPDTGLSWEIQRDLTDYCALLKSKRSGVALINNWIDETHNSRIRVTAKLLFYPADKQYPAPVVPSDVYSLNGDALPANLNGGPEAIAAEGSAQQTAELPHQMLELTRALTFPRNSARVYIDVIAQPQFRDEFFYQHLPNALCAQTGDFIDGRAYIRGPTPRFCGGGNFREVLVGIDGQPAGLAPVTPWVYTGGVDPFLWRPTPANETLNFVPARVDVSPFAGVLSDGRPHDVAIRVVGVSNFFAVSGAVLVYRDAAVKHTGGAIVFNSLKDVSFAPTVTSTLGSDPVPGVNGTVTTTARQRYRIEGYVNGAHGRITQAVIGDMEIANRQQFATATEAADSRFVTNQDVAMRATSVRSGAGVGAESLTTTTRFGLSFDTSVPGGAPGGGADERGVTVHQRFDRRVIRTSAGQPAFDEHVAAVRVGSDLTSFGHSRATPFHSNGQTSEQTFKYWNSLGDCYFNQVRASNGAVTGGSKGTGCVDGHGSLHWFVHPDGSLDSFDWRAR